MNRSNAKINGAGRTSGLSAGKDRRLTRIAGSDGRFSMLAIDQRESLQRMIAGRLNGSSDQRMTGSLRTIKRIITQEISPFASAVLTDPIFGFDSSIDAVPREVGVVLASEVSGYVPAAGDERRSRLIEGWNVQRALTCGADAVKLLIYHNPDTSRETTVHQQDLVESVGAACAVADMPFVLEIVTYALPGQAGDPVEAARLKPAMIIHGAEVFSESRFGVDVLKIPFPAELKYTEEYQGSDFGAGKTLYDMQEVKGMCLTLDQTASTPWVILSAGVGSDEFAENVSIANSAGASGYLCGRAVWKHVIDFFPDEDLMRQCAREEGVANFERIEQANGDARPWFMHRRFRKPSVAESAGEAGND